MNKKLLLLPSVISFIVSGTATAGGFQVNEHSATGLGRAFAGEAVIADNASVLARNPAAMAMFKRPAMSVGMTIIDTDVTVKNAQYQAPGANINANFDKESIFHFDGFAGFPGIEQDCPSRLCKQGDAFVINKFLSSHGLETKVDWRDIPDHISIPKLPAIPEFDIYVPKYDSVDILPNTTFTPIADVSEIGPTEIVPNFYYIRPINDKWAVGIAAFSNFGTGTEFKSNYPASIFGGKTQVKSMNLGLSASYRINQYLSLGAGLDIIYGVGELYRDAGFDASLSASYNDKHYNLGKHHFGANVIDIDATGVAFGWNVGAVYELNANHRFGVSYRHSPDLKAKGDVMIAGKDHDEITVPLPDIAEFSGYHLLTDKFAMHYSVQWIGWRDFDQVSSKDLTIKEYEWKNSWHYALGGTYYLNDTWTLRAGYMFDKSPVDELKSISIPDSDRQWYSAGVTYHYTPNASFDFGAAYVRGEDVNVTEYLSPEMPELGAISAVTRANAFLMGVQFSYLF
ncbi:TPA: outer membrane protein transport protein [Photobacterium damselae]